MHVECDNYDGEGQGRRKQREAGGEQPFKKGTHFWTFLFVNILLYGANDYL